MFAEIDVMVSRVRQTLIEGPFVLFRVLSTNILFKCCVRHFALLVVMET